MQNFEVEIAIALDKNEKTALADYLICSTLVESITPSVGEIHENDQMVAHETAIKLFDVLMDMFSCITLLVKGTGSEADSPLRFLKFSLSGKDRFLSDSSYFSNRVEKASTLPPVPFARLLLDGAMPLDPEITKKVRPKHASSVVSVSRGRGFTEEMAEYIAGRTDEASLLVSSYFDMNSVERRSNILHLRRLREFLRSRGNFRDQISTLEVVSAIYNGALIRISELRSKPLQFVSLETDYGSDNTARTEFKGNELSRFLFDLKNSPDSTKRKRYSEIREYFHKLTGDIYDVEVVIGKKLQESSPSNTPGRADESKQYLHEVSVLVNDGNAWIGLDFSAAGIFELLLLLTAIIGYKNKILMLDEPALNLHPSKQKELLKIIEESSGCGNQVFMITHSPYLASASHLEKTIRLYIENKETHIVHLGEELENLDIRKYLGGALPGVELSEILFASGMILVEGLSDKLVVNCLDQYLGTDGALLQANNWPVIMVGKDSFPKLMQLGNKWKIGWIVLTDCDGVMNCNSACKNNALPNVPGLFAFLIDNNIMTSGYIEKLAQFHTFDKPTSNGKTAKWYEIAKFADAKTIAETYGIFPLSTDLEGALEVSTKGNKIRNALLMLEKILQGKIEVPSEFKEFFNYVVKRMQMEQLTK